MRPLWVFLIIIGFVSIVNAEGTKTGKVQRVDFGDTDINGKVRSPDGSYLVQKRGMEFAPMYKVKKKLMLTFDQMLVRFLVALALGALIGLEREMVGKEAGIRTAMLVAGGASLFTIIALSLPYLIAISPANLSDVIARNSGFLGVIANIVVGIGFLGAGIIIQTVEHVRGLTTAVVMWFTAGLGVLAGLGLVQFAVSATLITTTLLYMLRKVGMYERVRPRERIYK